jgi:hypothetical protein
MGRVVKKGECPVAEFFSDEMRRNPYPLYDQIRGAGVMRVPPPFDD